MARTITEIQEDIIGRVNTAATLSGLTSTSKTAIWRMWTYVVAVTVWAVENLFDQHKAEVTSLIDERSPHHLRWYANKAKDFQYGAELVQDEDYYDTTGLTEEQINARKIVTFCAVVEQTRGLKMKVAKMSTGDLAPLTPTELDAFGEYMQRIKDAGVNPLIVESREADSLKLSLKIYYNPLVLDKDGIRLDGTDSEPVLTCIKTYLRNLPFNGVFVLSYLVDALQKVDGVVIPHIVQAQASYSNVPFTAFDVKYSPDAGYLRIKTPKDDLHVEYLPQSVII